jgi:hypothetical protein
VAESGRVISVLEVEIEFGLVIGTDPVKFDLQLLACHPSYISALLTCSECQTRCLQDHPSIASIFLKIEQ